MANVIGVDVSRWQGVVDWDAVSQKAGFAIIKAGGSDNGYYADRQFARNRDEARRLGLPHGYYYYVGGLDPVAEAEHFARIVGPLQEGEVVVLDYEIDVPNPVAYSWLFLERAEQLLGVKPMLYTNMKRVWTNDWSPVADHGNSLWGAIYDNDPNSTPATGAWDTITMKQYTSSGRMAGVESTHIDMNSFRGSIQDFLALGYHRPAPVRVPAKAAAAPPLVPVIERKILVEPTATTTTPESTDEQGSWERKIHDKNSLYYQGEDTSED
jgi:lysozyme